MSQFCEQFLDFPLLNTSHFTNKSDVFSQARTEKKECVIQHMESGLIYVETEVRRQYVSASN